MGKKLDSLIKLAARGFNTPAFEVIYPQDGLDSYQSIFEKWGRVSIRCDMIDPKQLMFKLPFFPNVEWEKALEIVLRLRAEEKYIVIASRGIDPAWCLVGGKWWDDGIEFFIGEGTIRDKIEGATANDGIVSTLIIQHFFPRKEDMPVALMPYWKLLSETCRKITWKDFVLEFSIYDRKVGRRGEYIIFWELISGAR